MKFLNLKHIVPIILLTFLFSFKGDAQKIYFWLDAGLKVQAGSGLLYNNNLINDRDIDPKFGFVYGFGGKFGFNFGDYHALTIDGLYSVVTQENRLKSDNVDAFDKRLTFNAIDLYAMYRYNRNLNYVELGVKYSIYQKFLQSIDGGTADLVDDDYVDNMLSPVLGFGYYMFNQDAFTVNLGFRLSYGINDLLSNQGIEKEVFTAPIQYDSYSTTNPGLIELVLEFNFGLGQYAKSVCGKRASFMGL